MYLFFRVGTFNSVCRVLFFYKITLTSTTLIGFYTIDFGFRNLLALSTTYFKIYFADFNVRLKSIIKIATFKCVFLSVYDKIAVTKFLFLKISAFQHSKVIHTSIREGDLRI